jgi:alkylation response protein AidB-like acyl-CoA dehydrogenase
MTLGTHYRTSSPLHAAPDPLAGFLAELDRFLVANIDARKVDADHRLPAHIVPALAELGVFGVSIPEAYGGTELGLAGACAIVDTLARRDRAVATTVGLHLGLGTRGLVAFGSEDQKSRWLPDLASGRRLAAFSTTEANAGSDLSRLSTRARVDGDRVTVDGEKIYVTNGGLAQIYTVAVATDGYGDQLAGRALMILERSDRGFTVGPEEDKLGLRGSSTTTLRFDGVEVGLDRLIGPPGHGPDQLAHVLAWGRTAMAAGCCGTAEAALDKTIAHVEIRRQFGKPLAAQPVVRVQLADMAATLHTMRAMVRATVEATHALERERISLATKVFASEGDWQICDMAVQLHGGSGYIEETGVPLLLRDARITRIFEGANDVLVARLGQLELTTRAEADASPGAESPDDPSVAALTARLVARARIRGLGALRDPVLLHQLGRLVILREAARAVARLPDAGRVLATHAQSRLRETAAAVYALRPLATTDAICDALLPPESLR